ncbi:MAG: hypothetical protein WCG42_08330 [Parachlamydiaceae bacterium]
MEKSKYQLVKNFITHQFQNLLQIHLEDLVLSKLLYIFWTGVEATTKDGKTYEVCPIGDHLNWMIEIFSKKESPYKKIKGDENPFVKLRFTGKSLTHLLQQANHDSIAWDAAKILAAIMLTQDNKLPKGLQDFVTKALLSEGPAQKRGQNPIKKLHRDSCIVMLVAEFEKNGFLPATKCSAFSSTLSICDAVVEAFSELGISLSYEAVKSIWDKRKSLKHIPSFRLDFTSEGSIIVGYSPIHTLIDF